eukprot:4518193-Prymnesium_polylepis.1
MRVPSRSRSMSSGYTCRSPYSTKKITTTVTSERSGRLRQLGGLAGDGRADFDTDAVARAVLAQHLVEDPPLATPHVKHCVARAKLADDRNHPVDRAHAALHERGEDLMLRDDVFAQASCAPMIVCGLHDYRAWLAESIH